MATKVNHEALRAIAERSGYTSTSLARELGLKNHSHISNLMAGRRRASWDLLKAIAAVLKVPVAAIVADPDGEKVA